MRVSGMHARQVRLRLRRVAAARLAVRYGVDLDADPARAAALVGPAAWALIDLASPPAAAEEPPMDVGRLRAGARAALAGREFVTPGDVKAVAVPALAHRLALQPEQWVRRVEPDQVVRQILDTVPTPAPADLPEGGT